jgi:glycosyltransferase involved in cell wall biosynthesis
VDALAADSLNQTVAAVIAREDSCLRSFKRARTLGVKTIYQLPTAFYRYVKQALEAEALEFPGVDDSRDGGHEYSVARCERKEEELQNAQYVLSPSAFVGRSLPSSISAEVITIPLGVDVHSWPSTIRPKEPLFLYVGNISLRKGVHRLLLAWKRLKAYRTHRLRLVGDMRLSALFLRDFAGMYDWIPRVPRSELVSHYSSAAAFVFNPLADGFGHVFSEAMSCRTAVLCSRSSGAPDLVTDGAEGRLFDYGDEEQLASTLEWALSHPAELEQMGTRARERAMKSDWTNFAATFLPWISSIATSSVQ